MEGWEGSLLEGKHQAWNEKRVLKMVSGSQRCDWSQFDSHRLGWERASNAAAPPVSARLWNWDRWLHSDRIIPNLVLIYTYTHNTFLQYDKENKQRKRRTDPGVPREHRPLRCVDHSWQIVSPQSDARVKLRVHYSITLRLFTNTKWWTPSEDHAQTWWIIGFYCRRLIGQLFWMTFPQNSHVNICSR